jgi:hypothetical protein
VPIVCHCNMSNLSCVIVLASTSSTMLKSRKDSRPPEIVTGDYRNSSSASVLSKY